jgi:hypothetical protein
MAVGEEKTLGAVLSFLDRQKLEHSELDEQYCTKVTVKNGAQLAFVSVFHTGKITTGGKTSPLKTLLDQMTDAILSGTAIPGQALPFEIDRFPDAIRERAPACDPVIVAFVEEAIRCIRSDALISAAFMLGAASEKAVNLLIYAYANAIVNATHKEKFLSRVNNRMISVKYDEFMKSYKGCKSKPMDPVLSQDLDILIGAMFQFCRVTRNEIGHPQIVPDLDKGALLANLGHFVTYISRIYQLMEHFEAVGVQI